LKFRLLSLLVFVCVFVRVWRPRHLTHGAFQGGQPVLTG